jgi:hypothetical protein
MSIIVIIYGKFLSKIIVASKIAVMDLPSRHHLILYSCDGVNLLRSFYFSAMALRGMLSELSSTLSHIHSLQVGRSAKSSDNENGCSVVFQAIFAKRNRKK